MTAGNAVGRHPAQVDAGEVLLGVGHLEHVQRRRLPAADEVDRGGGPVLELVAAIDGRRRQTDRPAAHQAR